MKKINLCALLFFCAPLLQAMEEILISFEQVAAAIASDNDAAAYQLIKSITPHAEILRQTDAEGNTLLKLAVTKQKTPLAALLTQKGAETADAHMQIMSHDNLANVLFGNVDEFLTQHEEQQAAALAKAIQDNEHRTQQLADNFIAQLDKEELSNTESDTETIEDERANPKISDEENISTDVQPTQQPKIDILDTVNNSHPQDTQKTLPKTPKNSSATIKKNSIKTASICSKKRIALLLGSSLVGYWLLKKYKRQAKQSCPAC